MKCLRKYRCLLQNSSMVGHNKQHSNRYCTANTFICLYKMYINRKSVFTATKITILQLDRSPIITQNVVCSAHNELPFKQSVAMLLYNSREGITTSVHTLLPPLVQKRHYRESTSILARLNSMKK